MVSRAFTTLPQSTEQILHADKYFSYEAPQKLAVPDFKNVLGPAWRRIDYDVNGEWGYYLILDEFLNDATESKRAAAGWGGDRFGLYETVKPGGIFVAQLTAWDTPGDAREFFDAYSKRTSKRYPEATAIERGDRVDWQTSTGGVVMELRGSRVAILEGVPANVKADTMVKMTWQQR